MNSNIQHPAKPTVLMIGNFLSASGASRGVCEDLAERLNARGWTPITTSHRPAKLPRIADMLWQVWHRRADYAVAQVDVYSGPAFVWAEWTCRWLAALKKPFVLTLHGGQLPEFSRQHPGRVARLLNAATVVTAPSAYLAEALARFRSDIRILPNAIDVQKYPYRCRIQPAPRLAWLRALHEIYDPVAAVRAVGLLVKRFPDVQLVFYGPDKGDGAHQRVQSETANLGLQSHVTLKGQIPKQQVPEALAQSDIFLNTTTIDNTPVSVVEAMACGLGVISTNVGGVPHLIDAGTNGLLVPPRDPAALAEASTRILTEPGLSERLSRNARATAEAWDWSVVLVEWETILSRVAIEGSTRPYDRIHQRH